MGARVQVVPWFDLLGMALPKQSVLGVVWFNAVHNFLMLYWKFAFPEPWD